MVKIHFGRTRFFIKIGCIAVIFAIFSLFLGLNFQREGAHADNAKAFICMRADSGEIFEESNSHARLPMASTTKTMTALVVVENCNPDEIVTVPAAAVGIEGSSVYLKEGDVYTVKELLYGLMLRSGNDAAVALAIHTAGSVTNFVAMMNLTAERLGLADTRFANPHGLHDDNHFTSAYDLCILGCYAMKNPLFREIVSTKTVSVGEGELKRIWCNKNKILSLYEGGNGIKTGYTKKAGRCLIASAEKNGVTVVSVVLDCPDMFNECMRLMDKAFDGIAETNA